MPTRKKFHRGYTLIELLVVVTLSVIVMLSAAGLFFTTLVSNSRKDILTSVKDEGDYAISQMEFLLRNAITLVPPSGAGCTTGMGTIVFRNADDGVTTLTNINGQIASQSATGNTTYLTSKAVTLTGPTFDCSQSTGDHSTYIKISFQLSKQAADFNRPQPVQETFTTSVNLRGTQ